MTTATADAAFFDNPQAGQGRPLPKKESDLFKNVVKFYESKQYKKGLKAADAILKRYPNHGETLCMKGLIVNAMANAVFFVQQGGDGDGGAGVDKKKEAVELVKKGLMMDMR
jgi:peptide alpha-N-acetyltransferase